MKIISIQTSSAEEWKNCLAVECGCDAGLRPVVMQSAKRTRGPFRKKNILITFKYSEMDLDCLCLDRLDALIDSIWRLTVSISVGSSFPLSQHNADK